MAPTQMHRIGILAQPDVVLFDLATPLETFERARDPAGERLYDPILMGTGPVETNVATLRPSVSLDAAVDTIVVPGRHDPLAPHGDDVLDALRHAAASDTRIMSICTGAFTLAAAGLLDGRRATTHWLAADALARTYPRVTVDPDVLYVDDGQVLTSAGAVAGVDLCLHVVAMDFGAAAAAATARLTVLPLHRDGGQAQFIARDLPRTQALAPLLDWVQRHLHHDLTVRDLAAAANTSPRSLYRQFEAQFNATPAQWLRRVRVQRARELLERTDLPLDAVATRVGFGSIDTLRRHVARDLGTTPARYRRRFRDVTRNDVPRSVPERPGSN